ncbi:MAG: hypothetical protein MJZ31_12490 [Bacteroidales bacterium]|nr:hypothetical protein [Bacteroidales bacterium]
MKTLTQKNYGCARYSKGIKTYHIISISVKMVRSLSTGCSPSLVITVKVTTTTVSVSAMKVDSTNTDIPLIPEPTNRNAVSPT